MGLVLLKNEREDSPVSIEQRFSLENFTDLNAKGFCTDIVYNMVQTPDAKSMQPFKNPVVSFRQRQ